MAVNCGNFVEGSRVVDKNFSRKYFSKGLNRRAFSSLQSEVKTSSSLDYLVVHIPCKLLFYVQVQITGFSFVILFLTSRCSLACSSFLVIQHHDSPRTSQHGG